jgi:hypothetical protein
MRWILGVAVNCGEGVASAVFAVLARRVVVQCVDHPLPIRQRPLV